MNRIFSRTIAQAIFFSEGNLITVELAVHVPRTTSPSQNGFPLPRDPAVIVGHDPRMRAGMEEGLILVREGDVDYHGRSDGQKTIPQRRPEFPGIVSCEMLEDEGFV